MKFAPKAYRNTRLKVTRQVENALILTDDLRGLNVALLQSQPQILPTLHMCTCPLLARDRLIGLANSAATPGRPSDQFKAWCTRRLKERERSRAPAVREHWFTERGWDEYIDDEEALANVIAYVYEGQGPR